MTDLYPNRCYNDVCYKETALYCYIQDIQEKASIISPLVKSVYQKNIFLISQPKHMLWVLK